jgi:hypothetical protein
MGARRHRRQEWEPFLIELYRIMGSNPFTVGELVGGLIDGNEFQAATYDTLLRVLPSDLLAKLRQQEFKKRVGWAFKHHTDRRFGEDMWRIVYAGQTRNKVALYQVQKGD